MILAIENAVSLVGMNDTNHGKRVGFIASQLGVELGMLTTEQHLVDANDLNPNDLSSKVNLFQKIVTFIKKESARQPPF